MKLSERLQALEGDLVEFEDEAPAATQQETYHTPHDPLADFKSKARMKSPR